MAEPDPVLPWVKLTLGLTAVIALAYIVLPIALIGGPILIGYGAWRVWNNLPSVRLKKAQAETRALEDRTQNVRVPSPEEFANELFELIRQRHNTLPTLPVLSAFLEAAEELYALEFLPPSTGLDDDSLHGARHRDALRDYLIRASPENAALIRSALLESFEALLQSLPTAAKQTKQEIADHDLDSDTATVPLSGLLQHPGKAILDLVLPFYGEELRQRRLLATIRDQLDSNACDASGLPFPEGRDSPKLLLPEDYGGDDVDRYLWSTPFASLFDVPVPLSLPPTQRFEHHWIVAGTGHGKTQTLQHLIAEDLKTDASLVIIDSQGDLIRNVSHLAAVEDRLVLVDPTDIGWPVQLNLFSLGENLDGGDMLERERLENTAVEVLEFVIGALLGSEMTGKQSSLFRYAIRALLQIPDATIHTFRELMEPGGHEKYREHINKLSGTAQAFFRNEFDGNEFKRTKSEVARRLYAVLENQVWERMFSHPKSRLDLFTEMNAGKVICINTAKDLLKQTGTQLFGRFFIAMVAMAVQQRAASSAKHRCFVYVDECQDYIANDTYITTILEQARKQNVGLVLAHQHLGQLDNRVVDSLAANTSIKFVGGVSTKDARTFAPMLRTSPEFIQDQARGRFAVHIRNHLDRAVSMHFPFGTMETLPKNDFDRVRQRNRERYAERITAIEQSDPTPESAPTFERPFTDL